MWTQGYLAVSVLVWVGYGLYCFFEPATLEEAAGLAIGSRVARTEVRAMYGCLQIAMGVMAPAALWRPALGGPTPRCLAFPGAGLPTSRRAGPGPNARTSGRMGSSTTAIGPAKTLS